MVRRRSRVEHESPPGRRPPHLEQAPRRPRVFIVGLGRLGSALARALADHGWEVEGWSRRRRRIPGVKVHGGSAPAPIAEAKLVLLTVPDRAIGMIAADLAARGMIARGQVVAHCAGALGLEPLEPAAEAGAEVGSLHPLVAASRGGVELRGKAGAIDGSPAAVRMLRRVARTVGMKAIAIPAEERVRYHAAASLAANGLVALADQAASLLAGAGLERGPALQALLPLMASSLENLQSRGLPDALTGPVCRGDAAVVRSHLAALDREQRELYRVLMRRALPLAEEMGSGDEAGLEAIGKMLGRRNRQPTP